MLNKFSSRKQHTAGRKPHAGQDGSLKYVNMRFLKCIVVIYVEFLNLGSRIRKPQVRTLPGASIKLRIVFGSFRQIKWVILHKLLFLDII